MVRVEFLGPIDKEGIELDIHSLKELKAHLQKDEALKEWLSLCAVAVNDSIVSSVDTPLKDGDTITLLPPVSGG